MSDLVSVGAALVGIIGKIIQQCELRRGNAQVLEELYSFLQSLQDYLQQTQEKALALRNNSAVWALGALREDLENAILDASNILNKGFVRSLWDANKIRSRVHALRERVLTSFQTRLSVAALDVAIEGKLAQDAFQEAMLKVNKELQESCFTTSISLKQEQQLALRKELRQALQPIAIAMESHSHRIEVGMSMIRSLQPQTSDAEKFFEDVLAALGGLSVKNQGDASSGSSSSSRPVTHDSGSAKGRSGLVKWYEDPVTWEIMCDPVKATDGHTYDRWTILGESCHMATSPFRPYDLRPFHIATDDNDVRSRLFHKFPEQESQFQSKRAAYRDAALHRAQLGHFADSASMLRHVLDWAPDDVECSEKLQYVQRQMRAASGKSIPSADDANLLAREVEQSRQDASIQLDNTSSLATLVQPQHLYPSRLDSARSNRHLLLLSPDGLSCRFRSTAATVESGNVGAAIADMAVPSVRADELRGSTTVFYFEISIEELEGNNVVGLGFTGSESFRNNFLPGCYLNSCGYHGDHGYIFADGRQVQQGGVARRIARQGDTMGAGIHHGHKEIFFVYNGSVVAVITNTLSGTVMPIMALGSLSAHVKVAFNDSAFRPEQRPSRLVISNPNIQRSIVSLSPDGLIAQYIAQPVPPLTVAELPVVSLHANYGACFRHPSQSYYFELTVIDEGDRGCIAIGFAHQNFFQANKQPGWYTNSCAYHGDDGGLFFGLPDMAQKFGPTFSTGDTIGAGIDHASSTIFFIKNGKKVGHTSRLRMSCALYPVVGLHSPNEVVSLNFGQAPFSFDTSITPNLDIIEQPTRLNAPSQRLSKLVSLSQDGLTAHYIARRQSRDGVLPVAALMADRAICTFRCSSQVYYFELTVFNRGESGYIAIGFCNQDHFNCLKQPGWYPNSCGYHGDDGRLFIGNSMGVEFGPTFSNQDIIGAGIDYSTNTIFFAKNGCLVGHTRQMNISYAMCPIIGLHSTKEKVHLNFGQAPFSLDTSHLRNKYWIT